MVKRPRLTTWLDQRRMRPVTLVSAPAGYGKSTLIRCWLEQVDCPTGWVSLDERNNELGDFLSYFLAAILTIFPKAMSESRTLLMMTPLPPVSDIANVLINEIDQIERQFILVLDDYQMIESSAIHELLSKLLLHPPRNLHLVLSTRMDPPLPLGRLRANGMLTEVRVPSLRFRPEESKLLFQQMIETPIDPGLLTEIESQAEGWVTGLRLAALALRHRIGWSALDGKLSIQNYYVTDYLVSEILAKQAAAVSDCMLKTSILERFCAGLCDHICFQDREISEDVFTGSGLTGASFLEWLQASNLFVIPLDDQREWFRYHHLFREFLQKELTHRLGPDEIGELHNAAGCWYAQNKWIEEALFHFLTAGNTSAAIELIAQEHYNIINNAQWPRLDRWLNLFPPQVIETSAELFMLKTLLVYHRGRWIELPAMVEQLETMLMDEPDQEKVGKLRGELLSLSSLLAYYSGDAERALSQARIALELTPSEFWSLRVFARLYMGLSLQMLGNEISAQQALLGAFEEEKVQNEYFKANVLMLICFIYWISADLQAMKQVAKQSITICQEIHYTQILGYCQTLLGFVHYQQNNLPAAEELFAGVVANPYLNYGNSYLNSVCGLAMTYQAIGKEAEAQQIIERAIAFCLETGNTTQLPIVQALQAEVALRQGNLSAACQWAEKLDPVPSFSPIWGFFAPYLTLAKVWLAQNELDSLNKAANLVNRFQEYNENIHNTRFLIETLALRALLEDSTGDHDAALTSLESALKLAQPGGFIRLFVDFGSGMSRLLDQLSAERQSGNYVEQIRSAFPGLQRTVTFGGQAGLIEQLTSRELQILELLGERLTNKEIAAQLVISPGTVKGHTIHIYDKLGVGDRRQAIEKAVALGILPPP